MSEERGGGAVSWLSSGTSSGSPARSAGSPDGFSLVELVVAMLLFGSVLVATLGMLSSQARTFRIGAERMELLHALRTTMAVLEGDLRSFGTGVPHSQPVLLFASDDAIAFSADQDEATAPTGPLLLPDRTPWPEDPPRTPEGAISPAELIILSFVPDSSTVREDDFLLRRQVNDEEPEVVARGLLRREGRPFLEYHRVVDRPGQSPSIERIGPELLPLRHRAAIHGSLADTGVAALPDSVRAVRVDLVATDGREGREETRAELSRLIRMPNAGLELPDGCGEAPRMGGAFLARPLLRADSIPVIRLEWEPSVDEIGGERDVVRYLVWRRGGSGEWNDPVLGMPATLPSAEGRYLHQDLDVIPGMPYQYAIAAQDCTPSLSERVVSSVVLAPRAGEEGEGG